MNREYIWRHMIKKLKIVIAQILQGNMFITIKKEYMNDIIQKIEYHV